MGLVAKNISFKYFRHADAYVLENVDFRLEPGITLLAGRSGSGKSTLAYILAGLYPENGGILTSGEVFYDGIDLLALPPNQRVSRVALMFQNPDLQFCMNTLHNELDFCLENIGVAESARPPRIREAVDRLKIANLLHRDFHNLSGGEKQKCALACIMAMRSQCIILDEAFANIDRSSAREIVAAIADMGVTVLAIDHNEELWAGVATNRQSLDGSIAAPPQRVASLPPTGEDIIAARDLVAYGINYPDMNLARGSVTALAGPSGSGKTTFFHTLIKQHRYRGSVRFLGRELSHWRLADVFARCGIVFQNPANQFLALNVRDEVLYSVARWYPKQSTDWKANKTRELLDQFGLARYEHYSPYMLSQGEQRRLAVLTMLAGEQEVLLLDEPTYGQDGENIAAVMNLVLEKAGRGLTVMFSTHNDWVAEQFAHSIIRLEGRADE